MDSQYAAAFLNILLLHLWEIDVRGNEEKGVKKINKKCKRRSEKGEKIFFIQEVIWFETHLRSSSLG